VGGAGGHVSCLGTCRLHALPLLPPHAAACLNATACCPDAPRRRYRAPPPPDPHLLGRVGVVGDEAELARAGRVDLLVLGGRPHAGDAGQLQLVARHGRDRQEAVEQRDREVQRVAAEAVLEGDLDQPVHQDRAHVGRHVLLPALHVGGVRAALALWGGSGVGACGRVSRAGRARPRGRGACPAADAARAPRRARLLKIRTAAAACTPQPPPPPPPPPPRTSTSWRWSKMSAAYSAHARGLPVLLASMSTTACLWRPPRTPVRRCGWGGQQGREVCEVQGGGGCGCRAGFSGARAPTGSGGHSTRSARRRAQQPGVASARGQARPPHRCCRPPAAGRGARRAPRTWRRPAGAGGAAA
jgi:hypothetical protein